jgi:hypothetical protein
VTLDLSGVRRASSAVAKIVLLFFLGISALIVWIVSGSVRSATQGVRQAFGSFSQVGQAVAARNHAWKVAERGQPTVPVVTGDLFSDDIPPYPSRVLPLTEVARRLGSDERFARPFLEGYMIFLDDEGWVWYLSPLARGSESLPRVRATDGRPWPWRR